MRWWSVVVVVGVMTACSQPSTETTATVSRPSATSMQVSTTPTPTSTTTIPSTTTTSAVTTSTTAPEVFGVLVFHATAGFRHDSISAGVEALSQIGEEHGFTTTATEDPAVFTEADLTDFEVVVFLNTTGDVLDEPRQRVMEEFVGDGKGFVGIHSATDTEYEWAWYGGLVGAYFDRHPRPQTAAVTVTQPEHPTMAGIPQTFERFDEWYDFRTRPTGGVDVLATLDEGTYQGGRMGDPHPITWAHEYEGGRSFYTAFGHTAESYTEDLVRTLLANGILWAAGR